MLVYDDVSPDSKITIYDRGVTKKQNSVVGLGRYENYDEFQMLTRAGDILIPKVKFVEPLKLELEHFIKCIRGKKRPITDGYNGLQVVQTLEAIEKSMASGKSVDILD
jgi:predicted dehydrogenase